MASTKMTIEVTKLPEALFVIRREFSNLLRSEAEAEADPRIARRLLEIADKFEAALCSEDEI